MSVAVERAGGQPNPIVFVKDRDPPSRAEHRAHETQIIHLHGYWRDSDTMHTMDQLGARRERLERWCEEVLRGRLLLVVGYAGWDDVFTRMIGSLADPHGTGLQVAWAFFSKRPSEIMGSYARLLDRFEQWRSTGRLRIYVGIDAHVLFERLLEQARREKDAEAPAATAATATAVPATVVPSDKARTRRHLRIVGSLSTDADRHAPHEDGAARATEPEPKGWKQLSLHQKDWLGNIVAQLTRLLDGGPGPWSYSARPELPRAAMLRSRLPEVCDVLNDLGSIRPDDWPDIAWALQLDEARAEAEAAVEDLNALPETLSPSLQDPPSQAWNTGVDTLEKALTGILGDIRRRYPRAGPRR